MEMDIQQAQGYIVTVLLSGMLGHWLVVACIHGIGMGSHLLSSEHRLAGKWIGILERMIITALVLADAVSATVFLFAAKAAVLSFRLPSRTPRDTQRQAVEYMLIGTMCSYLIALAFGFAGKLLI